VLDSWVVRVQLRLCSENMDSWMGGCSGIGSLSDRFTYLYGSGQAILPQL